MKAPVELQCLPAVSYHFNGHILVLFFVPVFSRRPDTAADILQEVMQRLSSL